MTAQWSRNHGGPGDQWPMTNDQGPMTNDQWPWTNGKGPMTNDQWPMTNNQWPMTRDQWPMTKDQWPMTNDQWAGTNDQWPMTNDQGPMTYMSPPQLTHAKDFCCCCCCLFFVAVVVVVFTDHGTALFWYWTRYTCMTGLIQHVVWSSTWSDPAHAWMMQPGNIHQPVYTHANKWKSIRKNFDMGHWWGGGGGGWGR